MSIKKLLKISTLLLVSGIYNFYIYAPELLTGEHEEPITEPEKQGPVISTQEPGIEQQQKDQNGTTTSGTTIEPIKMDTEEQRVISLTTQEGGPAKFSSSVGSIEVTSSRGVISTAIEAIRQFINTLRGVKGFENVTTQLAALDKTINDIARNYKIDDLRDLTSDKLSPEDQQTIQKNLNQIADALLILPETSQSTLIRKELDDFVNSVFQAKFSSLPAEEQPPLYKLTLDDVTNPNLHFKNGTEALTWLQEAKKAAEEAANSTKLTATQKTALNAATEKVNDIEFNLVFARQELGKASLTQEAFDNLQKQLETALNRFREPLSELTHSAALSPELEKLLFQESYAILVVARQALSELLANSKMSSINNQEQTHKEYLELLLNFAKENVKAIQSLNRSSPIQVPVDTSSSEEFASVTAA